MILNRTKVIISIAVIFMITACSPKKYSFEIDAPPKYSSEHIFKNMSIKNFKSKKPEYKESFLNMIRNGITKEGYIKIVQNGEEAILTGSLDVGKVYKESKTDSYDCSRKVDGKQVQETCHSFKYKKQHTLKVEFTLTNAKDNSIIYGDSIIEDFLDEWTSYQSMLDARAKSPSDEEIINKALKSATTKIIYAISPHKETVSRELQEGDSDSVKLGITYIKNGRVEQALAIWDQCISKTTSVEDKSASYYNIGVIKESKGEYRDAFDLYSNANSLMPKEELYIKAMTRAENLSKKTKKVRQWKLK